MLIGGGEILGEFLEHRLINNETTNHRLNNIVLLSLWFKVLLLEKTTPGDQMLCHIVWIEVILT